mmetsp:Transcript_11864/g.17640  ORF Transcript_11864/g.17640 Transcript_11864/m.17640 type:complete len:311 (+) Transcript_11864:149-1081(+)
MGQNNSTQDRNDVKDTKFNDRINTEEYLGKTNKVGHLFKWKIGDKKVNKVDLIGSFNDWENPIPMTYNHESKCFLLKLTLNGGVHHYRFIVDGKHEVDLKVPKEKDENGVVNNVISLSPGDGLTQTPSYSESLREDAFLKRAIDSDDEDELQPVPELRQPHSKTQLTTPIESEEEDEDEEKTEEDETKAENKIKKKKKKKKKIVYVGTVIEKAPFLWDVVPMSDFGREEKQFAVTKRMPRPLPPHLRFTPLNSKPIKQADPSIVPVPLHVTVRHVYTGNRENSFETYGITNRYKQKYTTVVFYKPHQKTS